MFSNFTTFWGLYSFANADYGLVEYDALETGVQVAAVRGRLLSWPPVYSALECT